MKTFNMYYKDQLAFSKFVQEHKLVLFEQTVSAILVQVFCGHNDLEYIKLVVEGISAELPSAHIMGATTFGEIMDGQVSGVKTVISITVFEHAVIRGATFLKNTEEHILGWHIAATLGSDAAKALILFGAGSDIKFDLVLKGIQTQNSRLLVAGGSAGFNSPSHPGLVFYNQEIMKEGFVGIVLEGDCLNARAYSYLGWQAIGKEMSITEAQNNRVYTIDGVPAFWIYSKYLGISNDNFLNAVEFPLIVNRAGYLMARTPKACYSDDSMEFFGEFVPGEKVRLSLANNGLIAKQTEELCNEIRQDNADSIFVYSCESRRGFLQELTDMETRPLQKIAPTSGFFTSGEYYHSHGVNHLLNATMTVLVLNEQGKADGKDNCKVEATLDTDILCPDSVDSIAQRSAGLLTAITHLINEVTAELEVANHYLNYMGLHDSLTEAYNRTFFDQEIKRLESHEESVGIIICDLDCLKVINDTFGHEFGDGIIVLLAQILHESCNQDDVVARIGGDEFAILVRGKERAYLADILDRIKDGVHRMRESDINNLVYLSAGFAFREKNSTRSLKEIFIDADNAMYQSKREHNNLVRCDIAQRSAKMNKNIVDSR